MTGLNGGGSRALDISSTVHLSPGTEDRSTASISQPQCDIFNTTFSLYQASPLFLGTDPLSYTRLAALSNRLRDVLIGDVVRGVEVGLDNTTGATMGSAGSLEGVTVEWFTTDASLGVSDRGLQMTLQYENAICSALLLPAPPANAVVNNAATGQFLHLPLLLLRMPTPLKSAVIYFLSSTFDCRIGPLRLSSEDLLQRWEAWAQGTRLPTTGPLAKDAVLTLGFRLPGEPREITFSIDEGEAIDAPVSNTACGLKAVDIIVPFQDLPQFFNAGKDIARGGGEGNKPLAKSLARYVKHHLALDMSNPAVSVVRIACGGFVLAESRVKIFSTAETGVGSAASHEAAVQELIMELAMRAARAV